jgi:hypothetical protein
MKLAALILLMPLAIIFTGLLWFASLWVRHQDDHGSLHTPREEESEDPISRSAMPPITPKPAGEFWHYKEACR